MCVYSFVCLPVCLCVCCLLLDVLFALFVASCFCCLLCGAVNCLLVVFAQAEIVDLQRRQIRSIEPSGRLKWAGPTYLIGG